MLEKKYCIGYLYTQTSPIVCFRRDHKISNFNRIFFLIEYPINHKYELHMQFHYKNI